MAMQAAPRPDLVATQSELDAAHAHLLQVVDAPLEDDYVNDRILAAMRRLREAQARHAAAKAGLLHLPDLVGWG